MSIYFYLIYLHYMSIYLYNYLFHFMYYISLFNVIYLFHFIYLLFLIWIIKLLHNKQDNVQSAGHFLD